MSVPAKAAATSVSTLVADYSRSLWANAVSLISVLA